MDPVYGMGRKGITVFIKIHYLFMKVSTFFTVTSEIVQIEASIYQELVHEKEFFIPKCLFKI